MGDVHNSIKFGTELLGAMSIVAGVDRNASGVERFGETLTPVLDIWGRPEWALLRGQRPWSFWIDAGAVAAEFSMVAVTMQLPATRQIVVVEQIQASLGTASNAIILVPITRSYCAGTLTTSSALQGRDARDGGGAGATPGAGFAPQGLDVWAGSDPVSVNALGATGETQIIDAIALRMVSFITVPRILRPGGVGGPSGILMQSLVANTILRVCMSGYIRPALPGELS